MASDSKKNKDGKSDKVKDGGKTDEVKQAWAKAESLIEKGEAEQALKVLRESWGEKGANVTQTWRLAGDAKAHLAREAGPGAKRLWKEAIKHYESGLKLSPTDKQTRRSLNSLRSEMDSKGIRGSIGITLWSDGSPTFAGVLAITMSLLLILVAIKYMPTLLAEPTEYDAMIEIELYPEAAARHVESFKLHAEQGNYDGVEFHRIIDEFMVQGGDIEGMRGSGGYAAKWYGYCSGTLKSSSDACDYTEYTLPDEANSGLSHSPGMLSMAKTSAAHTGGSQFFFVDKDSNPTNLDGVHTIFGYAVSGQWNGVSVTGVDVIEHLSRLPTDGQDYPSDKVPTIVSMEVDGDTVRMYINLD